jgi:diguanylate cyclase (GGDEF)-like protein
MDSLMTFNENYGHTAGDECLKAMAAALDSAIQRPGDFLARYSGDKFACMLPETDHIGAVSVAERLRAEVATLAIPHEYSDVSSLVTVSIGVATIVPIPEKSPEELLMVAEHRLLDAKDRGRNRIEFT